MHICVISDILGDYIGGAESSTALWIKELLKRGYKITVFTTVKKVKTLDKHENLKVVNFKGIGLKQFFGLKKRANIYLPLNLLDTLKILRIIKTVDIVYVSIPTILSFITMQIAKILNKPVVTHHHIHAEVIYHNFNFPFGLEKFKIFYYKVLINFYNSSDMLISPSKHELNILKKLGLKTASTIISNGIDIDKFQHANSKIFLNKYKINRSSKKILFVGRLNRDKNVELLIKASKAIINNYENLTFIIIGEGIERKKLERLVKELNLSKYFLFTGFVPSSILLSAYGAADIFVLPSFSETQGIVLLEASASGKPLIGGDNSAVKEIVINGYNGYTFKTNNYQDLANKIIKILHNKILLKTFSANSIKLAKNHDINKSMDILVNIFQDLRNKNELKN